MKSLLINYCRCPALSSSLFKKDFFMGLSSCFCPKKNTSKVDPSINRTAPNTASINNDNEYFPIQIETSGSSKKDDSPKTGITETTPLFHTRNTQDTENIPLFLKTLCYGGWLFTLGNTLIQPVMTIELAHLEAGSPRYTNIGFAAFTLALVPALAGLISAACLRLSSSSSSSISQLDLHRLANILINTTVLNMAIALTAFIEFNEDAPTSNPFLKGFTLYIVGIVIASLSIAYENKALEYEKEKGLDSKSALKIKCMNFVYIAATITFLSLIFFYDSEKTSNATVAIGFSTAFSLLLKKALIILYRSDLAENSLQTQDAGI
jgi:hypothetical protein